MKQIKQNKGITRTSISFDVGVLPSSVFEPFVYEFIHFLVTGIYWWSAVFQIIRDNDKTLMISMAPNIHVHNTGEHADLSVTIPNFLNGILVHDYKNIKWKPEDIKNDS